MTGINKTIETQKSEESSSSASIGSGNSSQTGHSKIDSSSKSWEASGNAGFNLFGFSIGGSAGGGGQTSSTNETNSLISHSSSSEITNSINNFFSKSISLSNSFDLSNSAERQTRRTFELELPSQELNVEGNQTIEINTFLDKVFVQVTLRLKQNISGIITANINARRSVHNIVLSDQNLTTDFLRISIREAAEILKDYEFLPQEIIINNDNTITFNGEANFHKEISTIGKVKINEIPTF